MDLFYETSIEQYGKDFYLEAIRNLKGSQLPDVSSEIYVENLVETQFQFSIPKLLEGITSELVLENSVGKRFEPHPNADYGNNHDVYATGIYHIPVQGNSDFFNVMPRNHVRVSNASVSNGILSFKIRTGYVRLEIPGSIEDDIKKRAIQTKENIETNLRNLEADLSQIRQELKAALVEQVDRAKHEYSEQIKRNKTINPF